MEIILLERVEKLGNMGDVVRVKDGYARNYLLPQKKALRATGQNRAQFEKQRGELEKANASRRTDAEGAALNLDGQICVLLRQASDSGHLYGSVTARDIAAAAASELGVAVDGRQVLIDRAIKSLGVHPIRVKLHPEVSTTVKVIIARSDEEAAAQRAALARGEAAAVTSKAEAGAGAEAQVEAQVEAEVEAEEFFEEGAGPAAEPEEAEESAESGKGGGAPAAGKPERDKTPQ